MSEENNKSIENESLEGQITVDEALKMSGNEEVESGELTQLEKIEDGDEKELTDGKKDAKKTKGYKLTQKTLAELLVLENRFDDKEEFIKAMIASFRAQRASELGYETRSKDIEQFNMLIDSLKILFIGSVELEKTTSDRVKIEFKERIDKLTKSVAVLTEEKIKLVEELKEQAEITKEFDEENKELINQVDVVQNLVNTKEEELTKEREQINTLTTLLNEFKGYKEVNLNLENENKELSKTNVEKEDKLKKVTTDMLLLEKDIENLKNNFADAQKRIVEAKEEKENIIRINNKEVEEYKKEIKERESELKNISTELNTKSIDLEKLNSSIQALTASLEVKEYELNKLTAKNSEDLEELKDLKQQNNDLINKIAIQSDSINNQKIQNLELTHDIKDLKFEIKDLTEEVEKQEKLNVELHIKLTEVNSETMTLNATIIEKNAKIKELETQVKELKSESKDEV